MSRHGYRGDGAFGQFCVVLPEQDVVVAITGCTEAMQAVLEVLWDELLPGLGSEASDPDPDAEAELSARLAGLSLPPSGAGADRASDRVGSWTLPVTPVERVHLESVEFASTTDGATLTLLEQDDRITLPVGPGEWAVSEPGGASGDTVPVAASGGWGDDGRFRAEVLFLETPHRLDVVLDVGAGTADVRWRLVPLGDTRLADLHCPRR